MLSLANIIWIRELIPHETIEALTREVVFPHDRIEIPDSGIYRVNKMTKIAHNEYHFRATKYVTPAEESLADP